MSDNDEPVRTETLFQNCIEWRRPSDNKLHRVGAPAVEYTDGTKVWFQNGEMHREDGPAYEAAEGGREYHLFGKEVSPQEFRDQVRQIQEDREKRREEVLRELHEACADATVLKTRLTVRKPLSFQRQVGM